MAERCVTVRVTGRVQGVWYRGWTQERAVSLGLTGWVRNEADGSVSALVCGPAAAVEAMLAAMRRGPEAARVAELEVAEAAAEPGLRGFSVRR